MQQLPKPSKLSLVPKKKEQELQMEIKQLECISLSLVNKSTEDTCLVP